MISYLEYRLLLIHSHWNLPENGNLKILSNKQNITNYKKNADIEEGTRVTHLRWLDTVFKGQYLPSLSINFVAINKVLEKLPPQLY